MAIELRQSTNTHVVIGPLVDETDGFTPMTSLTLGEIIAARITNPLDGTAVTRSVITLAASGDNEFTHLGDGRWEMDLTTTDTATAGSLTITIRDDDKFIPIDTHFQVLPVNIWDSRYGSDKLDVNVTQYAGQTATADATTNLPDVHVDAIASSTANATSLGTAIDTGNDVVAADATYVSGSSAAADNLETAATTLVGSKLDVNVGAISGDTVAADRLEGLMDGSPIYTVDDSGFTPTTTAFEADTTEATDDHYNATWVIFITGALAEQRKQITDYDGANKRFTVDTMTSAPANGDTFIIV